MSAALSWLGAALSVVLLVPSAFFMIQCLAAKRRRRPPTIPLRAPRVVVMMPAHDEEMTIASTLSDLLAVLDHGMSVLVVADNCTDGTASIAASLGVRVVTRDEPSRIGKGYAIERGLGALAEDPPEVVVILDADCKMDAFSLRRIADLAHHTQKPVQAEYVMTPSSDSALAHVSAFAFAVKNRVRPRGLKRMGVPILLGGTGMAFPFGLLRSAPRLEGHIAEDLLLGLELTLGGRAPILAEEAKVTSLLPSSPEASRRQRTRWEGGSLRLLRSHGARVVKEAIRYRRPRLLAVALDLAIPPLALLCLASTSVFTMLALGVALAGSTWAIAVGALPLACVAVGVASAFRSVGRELLTWKQLAFAPFYVMWKVPVYASMVVRGVPVRWERTAREQNE